MSILYYDCLMPVLSHTIILFFFWPYYNIDGLNWEQLSPIASTKCFLENLFIYGRALLLLLYKLNVNNENLLDIWKKN